MSPSCAVKARFWLFMSAIRFGTPTVACGGRVRGRSPHRPIAYVACSLARSSKPSSPEWRGCPAEAIPAVRAAAERAASVGIREFAHSAGSLPAVPELLGALPFRDLRCEPPESRTGILPLMTRLELIGHGHRRDPCGESRPVHAERHEHVDHRARSGVGHRSGPALERARRGRQCGEISGRAGLAGIVLTHDHFDHAQAVPLIRERFPDASSRGCPGRGRSPTRRRKQLRAAHGDRERPVMRRTISRSWPAPSRSPATRCSARGASSSRPIRVRSRATSPASGASATWALGVLAPGHGPPVYDVEGKLDQYLQPPPRAGAPADRGARRPDAAASDELLDDVWDDAPTVLRPAAAVTLAAHLDKLEDEGLLPVGVERPARRW